VLVGQAHLSRVLCPCRTLVFSLRRFSVATALLNLGKLLAAASVLEMLGHRSVLRPVLKLVNCFGPSTVLHRVLSLLKKRRLNQVVESRWLLCLGVLRRWLLIEQEFFFKFGQVLGSFLLERLSPNPYFRLRTAS